MKSDDMRKKENARVLLLMKQGHGLSKMPVEATWYPDRPIIEKDKEAIKRLYKLED